MIKENRWKTVDNLKRKLFLKQELKKVILKSISLDTRLPLSYRYLAAHGNSKIFRWFLISQQKNKCVRTGRVWSTVKMARYSRFVFRYESYAGNLPGFRRASW